MGCAGLVDIEPESRELRLERLAQLKSGAGHRKGLFQGGPNKCKLSKRQLLEVKRLWDSGITVLNIIKLTGHSKFIVDQAVDGAYDHLLKRYREDMK
jgi:hypothetical protein